MKMPNQIHETDDIVTDCPNPNCQRGWVEYEIDYFGRQTKWGRCDQCIDGEITIAA